jgi:hypothetical protein
MNLDFNCSLEDLLSDDDFIRYIFGETAESKWNCLDDLPEAFREKVEQAQRILVGDALDYRLPEDECLNLKNAIFDSLDLNQPDCLLKP